LHKQTIVTFVYRKQRWKGPLNAHAMWQRLLEPPWSSVAMV
jgi:hypothetical protein